MCLVDGGFLVVMVIGNVGFVVLSDEVLLLIWNSIIEKGWLVVIGLNVVYIDLYCNIKGEGVNNCGFVVRWCLVVDYIVGFI